MDGLTQLNFEDFKKIAKGLRSVYTSNNLLADVDSLKMWYAMLKDIPYEVLSAAVQKYISTNKFPPTIADLRELSAGITNEPISDWGAGWGIVQNYIHVYGQYRESEALENMDETTRQVVKRLGWYSLCISENPELDRANFRMIYDRVSNDRQVNSVLPMRLQNKIAELIDNFSGIREAEKPKIKEPEPKTIKEMPQENLLQGVGQILGFLRNGQMQCGNGDESLNAK
jgi:hypothetical protein